MPTVRPTAAAHLPALRTVLDSIELFPSDLLAEMSTDFLTNPDTEDRWLTALDDAGQPVGLVCCVPEPLTDGTHNMRAIGVLAERQGEGIGARLVARLEADLRAAGQRLLIVDTSGTEAFALTRKFYTQLGYTHAATLHDFWAAGDDKVIFNKAL